MNEGKDYIVYEWKRSQFLEKAEIILGLAYKVGIHRIEDEANNAVYLVPEEFYKRAVRALGNG